MSLGSVIVIGIIAALAGTAAAYFYIMPNNKRAKLPSFFKFLHDLFNFKSLKLEKIIKILYVFLTLSCIITGIIMIFGINVISGLIVMIIGPVIIRVIFEIIMMRIIEVQNIISINRKMKNGK